MLTYHRPDQWVARAANQATKGGPDASMPHRVAYHVDPHNDCEPDHPEELAAFLAAEHDDDYAWARVTLVLFSTLVSASIFASFNVTTFYTSVVLILGTQIKPIFLYGTWRGWVYEITHPDAVIKVIEACYMHRHEEDLIGEEETYRML